MKDPSAFSNNQQSLYCMGFFTSFRMTAKLPAVGRRRIPCQLISDYHYCAWDSSLTLRMTAGVCYVRDSSLLAVGGTSFRMTAKLPAVGRRRIPRQLINNYHCCGWDSCLSAGRFTRRRRVKDPSAFSNNQQSLLWMGFFADAQNDNYFLVSS